jgi:gliding motility-associated-like protein
MSSVKKNLIFCFVFASCISYGQRGKEGNVIINTANRIVNEYTALTANASAGAVSISVAASSLNANSRFSGPLAAGDLIMIIQMQGATILGQPDAGTPAISNPNDPTWGTVTNYNNCGNYEYAQVSSVPSSTSITLDCGLTKSYTVSGKVQVIRVPRYNTLTITSPGILSCQSWNGTTGGVLAVEVLGNTVMNAGAKINVTGTGFRGGALFTTTGRTTTTLYSCVSLDVGTNKGESIAGYDSDYTPYGGKFCRAAAANGGGGGNVWNCGGGGGSNAGNTATWTGQGNPNTSGGAGWTAAWNLESSGFAASTSSGGGRGGYSFSSSNQDATLLGPGTPGVTNAWSGSYRYNLGGLGGRPLDYSTGKIYLGGGGGAGEADDGQGGAGGNGGGIIHFVTYGNITGSGNDSIISNGANGGSTVVSVTQIGQDAAGGAGGGGTIILNSTGTVSGVVLKANGGTGGNQLSNGALNQAEGPGGGGGGGYTAVSAGSPVQLANGGNNGISQSPHVTEFTPNGATMGGPGLTNQTISNFTISSSGVSICSGTTATLTATLSGTVPAGTSVSWYTAQTGGTAVATGTSYTTPVLTTTTTYYVGTCPGTYRIPVIVTVTPGLTITVNSPSICSGQTAGLIANGGTSYSWSAGATSTGTNTADASPVSTTSYTVTGTTGSCSGTAVSTVTVIPGPSITVNSPTICAGQTANLTANGGTTYSWSAGATSTGTNTANASPVSTTTYTVTGTTSGCSGTAVSTVTVTPGPTISVNSPTICEGETANLTVTGGTTYIWSSGANSTGTNTADAIPLSTTSYTVTGTTSGCSGTAVSTVTVTPLPSITVNSPTICFGQTASLIANGGTLYSWSAGATSTGVNTADASPASTTSYTVTGTSGSCSNTAVSTVTVASILAITVNSPGICAGQTANLTANGATAYTWSAGAVATGINTADATPASTSSYTVTGTSGGCSGTAVSTVTVTSLPVITVNSLTICAGQTANLIANGGTTYTWSPGATSTGTNTADATPLTTTTYTVVGTTGGCSDSAIATVTINSPPITVNSPTICAGTAANLVAGGGTSYTWSSGATPTGVNTADAFPSGTTSYTVTGTSGGCTGTAVSTVTVTPGPVITVNSPTICAGQTAVLTASGASSYTWTPGATSSGINTANASPSVTTTYTVAGTAGGGCSGTAVSTVTVDAGPPVTVDSATICSGQVATLTASGATSYTWSAGATSSGVNTATVSPLSTTTYTVSGTTGGCPGTATSTVIVNLPLSISVNSPTICNGQTATLTATGASAYTWSPGVSVTGANTGDVTPTSSASYTVTETSSGCSGTAVSNVTVNPIPLITVNSPSVCAGETASLTASGGTTYTWSSGAVPSGSNTADATPISTASYTVTGTTSGCSGTAVATVLVNSLPSPGVTSDINGGCLPQCVNFTETSSSGCNILSYDFGDGSTSTSSNPAHCFTQSGSYSITISCTDLNGCTGSTTVPNMITISPVPVADFTISPSNSVSPNTSVIFTDVSTSGGLQYWNFGDSASGVNNTSVLFSDSHIYSTEGTYCITLISSNSGGCIDSTSECILVVSDALISIPNVFTPNGDGSNDEFFIESSGLKSLTCSIYDRWGLKLAEWDNVNGSWDGRTSSGNLAPDGVYFYMLKAGGLKDEVIEKQGFVQLLQTK